jgi:hypothetical protein
MTKRALILVGVFGVGVGFGCAAAPFVVPKASAQQAATLTKWESSCAQVRDDAKLSETGNRMGAESWELTAMSQQMNGGVYTLCFKRPKM